jgi:hypothetical protein
MRYELEVLTSPMPEKQDDGLCIAIPRLKGTATCNQQRGDLRRMHRATLDIALARP